MPTRAPNLVLFALSSLIGGAGCYDLWEPTEFRLNTAADLNAVVVVDHESIIVATDDGQLLFAKPHDGTVVGEIEHAGSEPLNALARLGDEVWAVGDNGSVLRRDLDGTWEAIDLGTSARLLDIAAIGDEASGRLVIVGDGVLRVQQRGYGGDDDEWIAPPEPASGWGELRAAFGNSEQFFAVGAKGVAWLCKDPSQACTAEDVGLGEVDLNAGAANTPNYLDHTDDDFVVVGDSGSFAITFGEGWEVVPTNIDQDLVEYAGGHALTRDGRLLYHDYDPLHPKHDYWLHTRVGKAEWLNRGLCDVDGDPYGNDLVLVGVDGRGRYFGNDPVYSEF